MNRHRSKKESLTPQEVQRFMAAAHQYGAREHAMFLFALAHGARAQEICNLRFSDLNFESGKIHIKRVKNSNSSLQDMLISDSYLFHEPLVLQRCLAHNKNFTGRQDGYVFNSYRSNKLSRITVYRLFDAIAKQAGIPPSKRHPHVLKHTLAMMMLADNAPLYTVQQALGHKDISSTMQYLQPSDAEASQAINKAFKKSLEVKE